MLFSYSSNISLISDSFLLVSSSTSEASSSIESITVCKSRFACFAFDIKSLIDSKNPCFWTTPPNTSSLSFCSERILYKSIYLPYSSIYVCGLLPVSSSTLLPNLEIALISTSRSTSVPMRLIACCSATRVYWSGTITRVSFRDSFIFPYIKLSLSSDSLLR